MAYNSNYRAPVNDVIKSNEYLTNAQLANLKKPALCTNTRMKISNQPASCNQPTSNQPASCSFFYQNGTNIAKNTASIRQTRSHSNHFPSYCRINITKQPMKYKSPLI